MATEPFLGQIFMVGFNFEPRGFAFCNGQLLPISQNSALFSLLGTYYGGNGSTTFALPDLRSRMPMHYGQGPGLANRQIGESAGEENVTLTSSQLPPHTHPFTASVSPPCATGAGNADNPVNQVPAGSASHEDYAGTPNGNMQAFNVSGTTAIAGGGQPHPNLPPCLCINFIIALQGIYPSRN